MSTLCYIQDFVQKKKSVCVAQGYPEPGHVVGGVFDTVAGTNTADLRPANQSVYSVQLSISDWSLSILPHKIVPKYNLYKSILQDLLIDTNRDVVFLVRHIVRISFVCINLCATRVTLRTVPRQNGSLWSLLFIYFFISYFSIKLHNGAK